MYQLVVWMILLVMMVGSAWGQDELTVRAASKSVLLSGYTRSCARMVVSSEVGGKVLKVHYDIGQSIGSRPFVEIDPTFINLQIEQVRRSLQKMSVANARAASRSSYLGKEFKRIDQLYRDDATTGSRHDAAAEELSQAQMQLQETDIEIDKLQTQLKELRERQARHQVYIPKGWVLVGRQVEPGEIISAGAPLGQAADFSRLVVPMYVTARELQTIEQNDTIELTLEGRKVPAVLNWINPEFDERTRKLAIELIIEEYTGVRRGGLLAELSLQIPASEGYMVPRAAVVNRYDNPQVIVADGRKPVPVVILGENGDYLLIEASRELSIGVRLCMPEQ